MNNINSINNSYEMNMNRRPSISSLSSYSSSSKIAPRHFNMGNNNINTSNNNIDPWIEQQSNNLNDQLNDLSINIDNMNMTDTETDNDNDELIPTAIVIKNIPFAIKKEQLLDVMTKLNLPLPYAFNYHFDNGVFRGLAFANFTSTDETCLVVNQLNGREIGGRKLRVEYKKMLPLQERERIERDKREKRGQLEEQHRSNSMNSLNSLISINSNQSVVLSAPQSQNQTPLNNTINLSETSSQQPQPVQADRVYINLPLSNISKIPTIDFNDGETLEIYSILLIFSKKIDLINEIMFSNISIQVKLKISAIVQYLNLIEIYENNAIIVKRNRGGITLNNVNINNINNTRYKNQSPMNLPNNRSFINQSIQSPNYTNLNLQPSMPNIQNIPNMSNMQNVQNVQNIQNANIQQGGGGPQQGGQQGQGSSQGQQVSSAALLRSNRSFVDMRNFQNNFNQLSNFNSAGNNNNNNINGYNLSNNLNNLQNIHSNPSTPNEVNSKFFGGFNGNVNSNGNSGNYSANFNTNFQNNSNSNINLNNLNFINNTNTNNPTNNNELFDRNYNNSSILSSTSSNNSNNLNNNDDVENGNGNGINLNLKNDNGSGIWGPK